MQTTEELKYRNPARPLTRGPFLDRRGFFSLSLSFFFPGKISTINVWVLANISLFFGELIVLYRPPNYL